MTALELYEWIGRAMKDNTLSPDAEVCNVERVETRMGGDCWLEDVGFEDIYPRLEWSQKQDKKAPTWPPADLLILE